MHLTTLNKIRGTDRFYEHRKYIETAGSLDPTFFSAPAGGGYQLQQVPEEFAAFLTYVESQMIVKRYLEIGSASGGFIRCIYERLGFERAMMIDDGRWQAGMQAENIAAFKNRVKLVRADSHSVAAYDALANEAQFDLIMIDGDHSFAGVAEDINLALPHAGAETLICFHDVYAQEEAPEVGPAMWDAIAFGKLRLVANFFKREGVYTPLGIAVCKRVFR